MPNLVLDSVSVATPDGAPFFPALSLTVGREAVGLFGRNGSGKTTLLRAIAGDGSYSGSILCNGAVGFLRQESIAGDRIVADVLGAAEDLARLRRIEEGRPRDDDLDRADWTLSARLEAALAQVDLPAVDWTRPYASFSGGERMR
ncbi:MAG: ABC transporter, partial [Sphingomonadaceae bacterium]|nr:ABC transporter [Sphingomonadaceae bacterium]